MSSEPSQLSVRELWRFPVKSVGGERLDEAEITPVGISGDRGWGIFDVDTGTVLTGRRSPDLLFASATISADGAVVITLPDGSVTSDDEALSDWLGRSVELRRAGDTGGTYEVPLDFENDENWVSWEGPGDAWHDSARSRVSLVSVTTLGEWDLRRFRTNVILDGAGENELVESRVRLGDQVVLEVQKEIDRCVMVTRPQPGLERDLDVLKTINAERGSNLAIGATVATAGIVRIGDVLTQA